MFIQFVYFCIRPLRLGTSRKLQKQLETVCNERFKKQSRAPLASAETFTLFFPPLSSSFHSSLGVKSPPSIHRKLQTSYKKIHKCFVYHDSVQVSMRNHDQLIYYDFFKYGPNSKRHMTEITLFPNFRLGVFRLNYKSP